MFVTNVFVQPWAVPSISRRERPAKPALSRDGIVAAAVEILRAEGIERVTMRRLAQALDSGAASLYVYVRDTADLHAAVLDELLGTIELTDDLHGLVRAYVDVLYAYPGLARTALVTRPSGPHYLALIERVLAVLAAAGLPGDRAAWLLDLLLLVATASAAEHSTRRGSATAQLEDDALAEALAQATPESFPNIAALGVDHLLAGPGSLRLQWFLDVLVNGGLSTPRPPPTGS
jgi:AcrR family transcriptional regulator